MSHDLNGGDVVGDAQALYWDLVLRGPNTHPPCVLNGFNGGTTVTLPRQCASTRRSFTSGRPEPATRGSGVPFPGVPVEPGRSLRQSEPGGCSRSAAQESAWPPTKGGNTTTGCSATGADQVLDCDPVASVAGLHQVHPTAARGAKRASSSRTCM